jgi:hypothetical protein
MWRGIVTGLLIGALTSSASAAGGVRNGTCGTDAVSAAVSVDRTGPGKEVIIGAAMIAGGFVIAMYGFGNPTGPPPNLSQPSFFPKRTGVGLTGIGVAVSGGVVGWHGWHRSESSHVQDGANRLNTRALGTTVTCSTQPVP